MTQVWFADRMMTAEGKATPAYLIKGSRNAHFVIRTTVTAWDSVGSLSYFHYTGAKYGYKATLRQSGGR